VFVGQSQLPVWSVLSVPSSVCRLTFSFYTSVPRAPSRLGSRLRVSLAGLPFPLRPIFIAFAAPDKQSHTHDPTARRQRQLPLPGSLSPSPHRCLPTHPISSFVGHVTVPPLVFPDTRHPRTGRRRSLGPCPFSQLTTEIITETTTSPRSHSHCFHRPPPRLYPAFSIWDLAYSRP
jgi:hypothetical protein